MSNIIKSGFVNLKPSERIIINAGEKSNKDNNSNDEVKEEKQVVTMDLNKSLKEKEKMLKEEEEQLKLKYSQIIEEANAKAEDIINEANIQANDIKEEALEQGKEEGLKLGLSKGQEELDRLEKELVAKQSILEEEYNNRIEKFETDFVESFITVFERISGIMIDEKQDVILHLVSRQVSEAEKSNNYVIRVSTEDFELVNSKKQFLYDSVSPDATIEIHESDNLTKNKCLIETDNCVIDCSLDTQLKNLIMDLKLLVKG